LNLESLSTPSVLFQLLPKFLMDCCALGEIARTVTALLRRFLTFIFGGEKRFLTPFDLPGNIRAV
jgi:hypothetical protein